MTSTDPAWLEDVVLAAQAGRPWALQALYEDMAPRVHGYLRARGAAEPEDLTSEVFMTVFTRLNTVTGGAAGLRTLLFSVAHARLVDDLRRRSRRLPAVPYEAQDDVRTTTSTEDEAMERLMSEELQQVLDELPDDQRNVLALRVIADLSLEQTAAAIGRSTGAVKQLQRRALLTVRARLQGEAPAGLLTVNL